MAYRIDKTTNELVIDGWEKGIAPSPYLGIGNIRNLNTSYYPGVAYVNYRRQATSMGSTGTNWYAGIHSVNVSNNHGWSFGAPITSMTNPIQSATSPGGINYILDDSGQIWKQSAANSSTFNLLFSGPGRVGLGNGGLAYFNNYLVVIGAGLIEFCGDGTGDAGITPSNWNMSNPDTAIITADYNEGFQMTTTRSMGDTSANLTSVWTQPSGIYAVKFSNGDIRQVTFTKTGASISWTGGLSSSASSLLNIIQLVFNSSTGFAYFYNNQPVNFSSTGTLPTPITAGTTYYLLSDVPPINGTGFLVSTTRGGTQVIFTAAGTGVITMNSAGSIIPIQNQSNVTFTFNDDGLVDGYSNTGTLATEWSLPSGTYNIVDPLGNNIEAIFAYEQTIITFVQPTLAQATGIYQVNILNPSVTNYHAYVSKVDGNLYFANGRWLGSILTSPNVNVNFNPAQFITYSVSYGVIGLEQELDTITTMTDLKDELVIAGNYDLYSWDYVSSGPKAPSPIGEKIYGLINILNNLYVTAGTKGNIYVSNGDSAQLLSKLPDYVLGTIDPIWQWGGLMGHRSKLWVQALGQSSNGTNILGGIFSLLISPGLLGEQASGLVMEAQNSYGLTPTSGALQNGLLIDNERWSSGIDSYYSAWSNGATVGGIDYNDNTLWQNFEPIIETDIIPIGSILDKKTFGEIQFKLDRPMTSGDQISIYSRTSLTDNYTLIKTTSSSLLQLSDYFASNWAQAQWIQFKIAFKCASSSSSFIPLREIRIQIV